MKTCSKCEIPKDESEFYLVRISEPEGRRHARCKGCHHRLCQAWTTKNKEKHRQLISEWNRKNKELKQRAAAKFYADNREKIRESSAQKYRSNREAILASNLAWKKANPDRVSQMGVKWFSQNKLRINARNRQRRQADPQFKVVCNLRKRLWNALKGRVKFQPTMGLLGCPLVWLEVHLESLFKPGMTWENYGPVWHVDHIKPCALFDLTNQEQQKICFHWTNLQPLFALDNLRKSDSYHG